jgi:hypothetical protein
VEDGIDQPIDIAVVQAGQSVAQVDGDPAGQAGRQAQDSPFAS